MEDLFLEKGGEEVPDFGGESEVGGELKVVVDDVGEEFVLVPGVVWRQPDNQFVEQGPQAVEVDFETVAFPVLYR